MCVQYQLDQSINSSLRCSTSTYHANGIPSYFNGFWTQSPHYFVYYHGQLVRTWTKFELTICWNVPGILNTGKGYQRFRINNWTNVLTFQPWFVKNVRYSWLMSGPFYHVYLQLSFINSQELYIQILEYQCPGSSSKHNSDKGGLSTMLILGLRGYSIESLPTKVLEDSQSSSTKACPSFDHGSTMVSTQR